MRRLLTSLFLGLALVLSACAEAEPEPDVAAPEELTDVLVQNTFLVNGGHTHIFVADEQGYFAEEGINLSYRDGEGAEAVLASLARQGDENVIAIPPLNQAAATITRGLPMIAVAGWQNQVPGALAARPGIPLDSPEDLVGQRVALKSGLAAQLIWDQFLEVNGIDADQVELVEVDPGVANAVFLRDEVDVVEVFTTNELPLLEAETGEDLDALLFADWGFPDLGLGVVVHRDFFERDPELIQGFLRATSRGIEFVKENPEESARIIFERFSDTLHSEEVVLGQLMNAIQLMPEPPEGHLYGWTDPERWEEQVRIAEETGVIDEALPLDEYFTNEFVE